jgi:hypothetical protein
MSLLEQSKREIVKAGFAFIRGGSTYASTTEAATKFGFIDCVEGLNEVQRLTPLAKEAALPNTYSGNFGISEFPLHTDLAHWATPPRFFMLRCIRGAQTVVTKVLDGSELIRVFGEGNLRRIIVKPRRPLLYGMRLLRLYKPPSSGTVGCIRWDSLYLLPASGQSGAAMNQIEALLLHLPQISITLSEPGDILIVDNWRCLHGRSPVEEEARDRLIERVYLKGVL